MNPERLSRHDAQTRLRNCLELGRIMPHPHFLKALRDEQLSFAAALQVLRNGTIYDEPEFSVRFQQWRYAVEGAVPDGVRLRIVFTFVDEDTLLITAFTVR